jgi:hypothetical protein
MGDAIRFSAGEQMRFTMTALEGGHPEIIRDGEVANVCDASSVQQRAEMSRKASDRVAGRAIDDCQPDGRKRGTQPTRMLASGNEKNVIKIEFTLRIN